MGKACIYINLMNQRGGDSRLLLYNSWKICWMICWGYEDKIGKYYSLVAPLQNAPSAVSNVNYCSFISPHTLHFNLHPNFPVLFRFPWSLLYPSSPCATILHDNIRTFPQLHSNFVSVCCHFIIIESCLLHAR